LANQSIHQTVFPRAGDFSVRLDNDMFTVLMILGTIFALFTVPIATIIGLLGLWIFGFLGSADWCCYRTVYSIPQQIANQTHHTCWKRTDIYFYKNNLTETRIIVIL